MSFFIPDLVLLHAPSVYDFRKKTIMYGPISDVIPSTPVFEMYPIGFSSISEYLSQNGLRVRIINLAYHMLEDRNFDVEKTIKKFDLSDRIRFTEGDYVEQTIEGVYDVAWLSHILHGEGPDTCIDILKKAVSVLAPGGRICIHEFILTDAMDGPLFPALFSINMLLGTASGRSYSQAQLIAMLEEAGVTEIKRLPYVGPTESGVIIGTT